jgi:AcrR family transcriptional regulator
VGRRPGDSGTREAILAAAKEAFGSQGYGATSVRAVARAAGVDPSLVLHFFGSKDGLFEAALALPVDPAVLVAAVLEGDRDGLGERVVRAFLGVWDGTPGQGPMLAMLRSAVSHEDSAAMLRELLLRVILRPVAQGAGAPDPDLRAALLASQVVGLAVTRYVLRLEPVASASADQLAGLVGPTLQRYLTADLPLREVAVT